MGETLSSRLARLVSAALGPLPLGSYDRLGYRLHQHAFFQEADLSVDLAGRVYLVTGANSGIGAATAHALAARGAQVWMLCRDRGRAEEARAQAPSAQARENLHIAQVDMADLSSVAACCAALPVSRIDGLIHNAGVLPAAYQVTADGLELTLATNLVGPYRMTRLLLPRLCATPGARLIFVSSGGMYSQRLEVARLAPPSAAGFDGVAAYARTKRAQVVLARLLAERLPLRVHSMHPGWADTPAVQTSLPTFHRRMQSLLRTPAQGADTVIWLAISARADAAPSGQFWLDRRPQPLHIFPWTQEAPQEPERLLAQLDAWSGSRGLLECSGDSG